MCLAIYKPAGLEVVESRLKNGFENNDDGAGFAVAIEGALVVRKGFFKFDEFLEEWNKWKSLPAIIHFRAATHGGVSKENCHPFEFGNGMYAAVHNGILPIQNEVGLSDTATFVKCVLDPIVRRIPIGNPSLKYLIERAIGTGNKILVLTSRGNCVMFNEGIGHWESGVWYSNYTYNFQKTVTGHSYSGWKSDGYDYETEYDSESSRYPKSNSECVGMTQTSPGVWSKTYNRAFNNPTDALNASKIGATSPPSPPKANTRWVQKNGEWVEEKVESATPVGGQAALPFRVENHEPDKKEAGAQGHDAKADQHNRHDAATKDSERVPSAQDGLRSVSKPSIGFVVKPNGTYIEQCDDAIPLDYILRDGRRIRSEDFWDLEWLGRTSSGEIVTRVRVREYGDEDPVIEHHILRIMSEQSVDRVKALEIALFSPRENGAGEALVDKENPMEGVPVS